MFKNSRSNNNELMKKNFRARIRTKKTPERQWRSLIIEKALSLSGRYGTLKNIPTELREGFKIVKKVKIIGSEKNGHRFYFWTVEVDEPPKKEELIREIEKLKIELKGHVPEQIFRNKEPINEQILLDAEKRSSFF